MDRSGKEELVSALNAALAGAGLVVVTQQKGLTVAEVTNLRRKMLAAGASFKVAKNRLAKLALTGTSYEDLSQLLVGPTALAYSADPVAAAKIVVEFAKTNDKLTIVGGSLGGKPLDANAVKALATLPSLDELRGKIIGVLQAPASKVAAVVQAPASQLARVVKAYAEKSEAA
ncbi:50S ribosomal protein L10 [Lacibacterium aquatile]|uniref:Large ribosomal subunit protein uL10 n=1 Tax=Lacibacterium aquatile TaxID=1168082 RepID=A0ABW5DKD4_9PROT